MKKKLFAGKKMLMTGIFAIAIYFLSMRRESLKAIAEVHVFVLMILVVLKNSIISQKIRIMYQLHQLETMHPFVHMARQPILGARELQMYTWK